MKQMKWKPDRISMLFGMFMGVFLGIGFATVLSPVRELRLLAREQDLAVAIAMSTLDKLATNDVSTVQDRLNRFVASTYVDNKTQKGSWFVRAASSLSPDVVSRVEKAAEHMPELRQAIREAETRKATNK